MSDCCDDLLFIRAGDAWPMRVVYSTNGVPEPLPGGARLDMRSVDGDLVLSAEIGDGLTHADTGGVTNVIEVLLLGSQTLPLAMGNQRTELLLAIVIFDIGDPDGTRRTILTAKVRVLPKVVE